VNTTTQNEQLVPTVTSLADGGWVVTWTSNQQTGSGFDIYAQRYGADGAPQGGEFRINTFTPSTQALSSVAALPDGGWIVAWQSSAGLAASGIYGQRYSSEGLPQGSEVQIKGGPIGKANSSVAALIDGGWVVTWQTNINGAGGISGQRYDSTGSKVGFEFLVNTFTRGPQTLPSVVGLTDGGWIITWSSNQDGSGAGVFGQRYDSSGSAVGSEFQLNTNTALNQTNPFVTALSDGGWLATWQSDGQDGSSFGIYGQRYNAAGNAVSGEFQVNTFAIGSQINSSVAILADGGWLVTWQSAYQDG
jgi:hypothetical protein